MAVFLTAKGVETALRGAYGDASRLLLREGEIVRQIIIVRWEQPNKLVPIGGPVELVSGQVDNVQILTAAGEILWSSPLDEVGVNTVSGRVQAGQLFYSWSLTLDGAEQGREAAEQADAEIIQRQAEEDHEPRRSDRVVLQRPDGSEVVLEAFQFKEPDPVSVPTDRDTARKAGRFPARAPGLGGVFQLLPPATRTPVLRQLAELRGMYEAAPDWHQALELLVCQGVCPWCGNKIEAVTLGEGEGLTWNCFEGCNP